MSIPNPLVKVLKDLNDKLGVLPDKSVVPVVTAASALPDVPRVPFEILRLDVVLGGGFPVGRIVGLVGHESSGKTTIALKAIAAFQRHDRNTLERRELFKGKNFEPMRCCFLDVEGTFDKVWAAKHGVDTGSLLLSQPEYAEQAVDVYHELLRSGEVDFFVLDSIAALTPLKEIEASAADALVGESPRLVNRMVRGVVAGGNAEGSGGAVRRPSHLWINQIRMKIGVMFGSPETEPGGMGQKFAASIKLRTKPIKYQELKKSESSEEKEPTQAEIGVVCTKNKTAPPRREGTFVVQLVDDAGLKAGEISDFKDLVKCAEVTGLLKKKDGTGYQMGKFEAQTKTACVEHLQKNPQDLYLLRQAVVRALVQG